MKMKTGKSKYLTTIFNDRRIHELDTRLDPPYIIDDTLKTNTTSLSSQHDSRPKKRTTTTTVLRPNYCCPVLWTTVSYEGKHSWSPVGRVRSLSDADEDVMTKPPASSWSRETAVPGGRVVNMSRLMGRFLEVPHRETSSSRHTCL